MKISFEEYQKIEATNHSALKAIDKSPWHYKCALGVPHEETAAMALGTYVHALVLEPEIAELFIVAPKIDKRTTAGKQAWATFLASLPPDARLISQEQHDTGKAMHAAIMRHNSARKLLELVTDTEVTQTFTRGGVKCKARIDAVAGSMLLDIKTTQDASPAEFGKSAYNYSYHTQAEWYCDALDVERFVFIAVESLPPYDVVCYAVPAGMLEVARRINDLRLERLADCLAADVWPGIASAVQELELPGWAVNKLERGWI